MNQFLPTGNVTTEKQKHKATILFQRCNTESLLTPKVLISILETLPPDATIRNFSYDDASGAWGIDILSTQFSAEDGVYTATLVDHGHGTKVHFLRIIS